MLEHELVNELVCRELWQLRLGHEASPNYVTGIIRPQVRQQDAPDSRLPAVGTYEHIALFFAPAFEACHHVLPYLLKGDKLLAPVVVLFRHALNQVCVQRIPRRLRLRHSRCMEYYTFPV